VDSNYTYSLAVMPEPVTVLRLPLRPLSIGHRFLLHRIQSPFLDPEKEPTEEDLLRAVLLCADTFEIGEKIDCDRFLRFKVWLWKKRLKCVDLEVELVRFKNYLIMGSLGPRIKPSENGRALGSPWLLRLKNFVQFKLKKSESEAWNYPYGRAQFEWATHWEEEGGLKIYNQDELDFIAQCDRMEAEEAAAEAAKKGANA
jgi:hypothetical protein